MSQEIHFTTSGETDVDHDDPQSQEDPRNNVHGEMDISPSEETLVDGADDEGGLAPKKQARALLKFFGSSKNNSQSPEESQTAQEIVENNPAAEVTQGIKSGITSKVSGAFSNVFGSKTKGADDGGQPTGVVTNNNGAAQQPLNRLLSSQTETTDIERGERNEPWYHELFSSKKNVANGMMDLALLTANASQLRYVLQTGGDNRDAYYLISLVLISTSIFLQIVVGVLLIVTARYNYRTNKAKRRTPPQSISDATVFLIFMISVINIFIATFGVTTGGGATGGGSITRSPTTVIQTTTAPSRVVP